MNTEKELWNLLKELGYVKQTWEEITEKELWNLLKELGYVKRNK